MRPAVGEPERDLPVFRQRLANGRMGLRSGADDEESASAGPEQLAAPGARFTRPPVEAIDRLGRCPRGRGLLQLPPSVEQLSDRLNLAADEAAAHLVGEIPKLQERLVITLLDRGVLTIEDLVATLAGNPCVEEE